MATYRRSHPHGSHTIESGLGVADRQAYEAKFRRSSLDVPPVVVAAAHQLRRTRCSINHWDDFGNVFAEGLESVLSGDKMRQTKAVLMGLRDAGGGSPCRRCQVYADGGIMPGSRPTN